MKSPELSAKVSAWEETISIPTYPPPPPDPNPMFFEKRVNQGASGKIYPNPFTDRVSDRKVNKDYRAIILENEFIQLIILPDIGGRIFSALDKTNGYDFIYRQHVIKPQLIGLFGSWISGGMEFNWPLHHRPSTFMPVDYTIQNQPDGSSTVWLSEHEPMTRMKGMLGICLHPGKAFFELKGQLFNRTALPQTFLWWVNTAVSIQNNYQIFFPPDVSWVTFHSKSTMATYPVARQLYAGLDLRHGVDISLIKNSFEATSYFAAPSGFDFFGGYDHDLQAGIVHVANHHISPGKKMFTWGTAPFGQAWQENLTDEDGPYAELMASMYSDNQPDFSWLQPYESRTFSQFWYPIQKIGTIQNANRSAALHFEVNGKKVNFGICSTESFHNASIKLMAGERELNTITIDLVPGEPFQQDVSLPDHLDVSELHLHVYTQTAVELIHFYYHTPEHPTLPDPATPPPLPEQIESQEKLFLTGLHVEQYRHPTLDPSAYWERALKIDPGDMRSNNALGLHHLRRGDLRLAESHFRQALRTLTHFNENPYDGEPYYNLGLTQAYQEQWDDAYAQFYKATWSYAWRSASFYALAQIDCRRGAFSTALAHLDNALITNTRNFKARNLRAAVLRHLGRTQDAWNYAMETIHLDPLDFWAHFEGVLAANELDDSSSISEMELAAQIHTGPQLYLDISFDYAKSGLYFEAAQFLQVALDSGLHHPVIYYFAAECARLMGHDSQAERFQHLANTTSPLYCFPFRIEEMLLLEKNRRLVPHDGRVPAYLGMLYYDKQRYEDAILQWEAAVNLEPKDPVLLRNLGIAYFNQRHDPATANQYYQSALLANPKDARLLYESDLLWKRMQVSPAVRLERLEQNQELVEMRDDLSATLAGLFNQTGQPERALQVIANHQFHPWEGGEGRAPEHYVQAHLLIGSRLLGKHQPEKALIQFEKARVYPKNLGEGRNPADDILISYLSGIAYQAMKQEDLAKEAFQRVVDAEASLAVWDPHSPLAFYASKSLLIMEKHQSAQEKLQGLLDFATERLSKVADPEFSTSRPNMEVFDEDPRQVNRLQAYFLMVLAQSGLGNQAAARQALDHLSAIDLHYWPIHFFKKISSF